jgi:hypothetical protein
VQCPPAVVADTVDTVAAELPSYQLVKKCHRCTRSYVFCLKPVSKYWLNLVHTKHVEHQSSKKVVGKNDLHLEQGLVLLHFTLAWLHASQEARKVGPILDRDLLSKYQLRSVDNSGIGTINYLFKCIYRARENGNRGIWTLLFCWARF